MAVASRATAICFSKHQLGENTDSSVSRHLKKIAIVNATA